MGQEGREPYLQKAIQKLRAAFDIWVRICSKLGRIKDQRRSLQDILARPEPPAALKIQVSAAASPSVHGGLCPRLLPIFRGPSGSLDGVQPRTDPTPWVTNCRGGLQCQVLLLCVQMLWRLGWPGSRAAVSEARRQPGEPQGHKWSSIAGGTPPQELFSTCRLCSPAVTLLRPSKSTLKWGTMAPRATFTMLYRASQA